MIHAVKACMVFSGLLALSAAGCDDRSGKFRGVGGVRYDVITAGKQAPSDPNFNEIELKKEQDRYRVSFGACSFTVLQHKSDWKVMGGAGCASKGGEANITGGTFSYLDDGSAPLFNVRGETADGAFIVNWSFVGTPG
jgi:hypothetical protein